MKKPLIIAEVKTTSPFGFKSNKSWDELFQVANKVGNIISIHTDSRWRGSFDLIKKAKKLTSKPILAKGIHDSDEDITKAVENEADYILVVGRIPKVHQNKCLIEPISLDQLKEIPKDFKVVWNSRDLDTGGNKEESFEEARSIRKGWLCQASNIKTYSDIKEGADAVLVGQNLIEFSGTLPKEKGLPFLPTHDPKKIKEQWDRGVEDALKNGKRYTSAKELFDDISS